MNLHEIYVIEDLLRVIEIFPSTGYGSEFYDNPLEITGEMKAKGNWGGLRIYGDPTTHHYIHLGQNYSLCDEQEKICYKIGSSWTKFKAIIGNGVISLYINDNLVRTMDTDTSEPTVIWGGSNANPVDVRNVKIKSL